MVSTLWIRGFARHPILRASARSTAVARRQREAQEAADSVRNRYACDEVFDHVGDANRRRTFLQELTDGFDPDADMAAQVRFGLVSLVVASGLFRVV